MNASAWTLEHERIARLVSDRAGLSFPEIRHDSHLQAIARAMKAAAVRTLSAYYDVLQRDDHAVERLAAELTIGETYFFRDAGQFELLRERIIPEIAARKGPGETLRVWSAGCATGEEAYSLAIVLAELDLLEHAHVIGTDIARDRLERARAGRYGRWSFRGVPDDVRNKYFERHGSTFQLTPAIREHVEFRYFNLAEDACPSLSTGVWGMDLVLCRNVLIYFEPAAVGHVTRALIDSLAEGGWLLLGASDPTTELLRTCKVIATPAGLVYRKLPKEVAEVAPVRLPTARPQLKPPPTPPAPRPAWVPPAPVVADDAAHASARVRSLANQGHLPEAERECVRALERHHTVAELAYLHSVLLTERGHYSAALRAARQALYLEPQLIVAHLAVGTIWLRLDDVAAAARSFRNAERLLAAIPEHDAVPAADGEPAGRLLELTRAQLRLALAERAS